MNVTGRKKHSAYSGSVCQTHGNVLLSLLKLCKMVTCTKAHTLSKYTILRKSVTAFKKCWFSLHFVVYFKNCKGLLGFMQLYVRLDSVNVTVALQDYFETITL